MKDEAEIREMLDKVLARYDKEAAGQGPTDSTHSLRSALEWVLGENDDLEEDLQD